MELFCYIGGLIHIAGIIFSVFVFLLKGCSKRELIVSLGHTGINKSGTHVHSIYLNIGIK